MHQAPPEGLSSVDAQTVITITRMIMIMIIPNNNQIYFVGKQGERTGAAANKCRLRYLMVLVPMIYSVIPSWKTKKLLCDQVP